MLQELDADYVLVYVLFYLIEGSFIVLAISTKFALYPTDKRDRIRLLGEILAQSAGAACVGLVFALPKAIIPWTIGSLFIALVVVGVFARSGYFREIMMFLKSSEKEEQDNAIALFDLIETKEGCDEMMSIITDSPEVSSRINVLNTFASLGTVKPASKIIHLLRETDEDTFRIAILRYLGNIDIKKLDPFQQHMLFETLRDISKSHVSNILRAMAVKLWVIHGPLDQTVSFIMHGLAQDDNRIVANAIEGLNYVNYPGIIEILTPYLKHEEPRIRANTIVTLWKYDEIKAQVQGTLNDHYPEMSEEVNALLTRNWEQNPIVSP